MYLKKKVNACIIVLINNRNFGNFSKNLILFEKNFNHKFNYPYVFFNNEEFSSEVKKEILSITKAKVEFGLIPREQWTVPEWIDLNKLKKSLFCFKIRFLCGGKICNFCEGKFG